MAGGRDQPHGLHALDRVGGRRDFQRGLGLVRGHLHGLDRQPLWQIGRLDLQQTLVAAPLDRHFHLLRLAGNELDHAERVDAERPVVDFQRQCGSDLAAVQRGRQTQRICPRRHVPRGGDLQRRRRSARRDRGDLARDIGRRRLDAEFHRTLVPFPLEADVDDGAGPGLQEHFGGRREAGQAQCRDLDGQALHALLVGQLGRDVDLRLQIRVAQSGRRGDFQGPRGLAGGDVDRLGGEPRRERVGQHLDRALPPVPLDLQRHGHLAARFQRDRTERCQLNRLGRRRRWWWRRRSGLDRRGYRRWRRFAATAQHRRERCDPHDEKEGPRTHDPAPFWYVPSAGRSRLPVGPVCRTRLPRSRWTGLAGQDNPSALPGPARQAGPTLRRDQQKRAVCAAARPPAMKSVRTGAGPYYTVASAGRSAARAYRPSSTAAAYPPNRTRANSMSPVSV